MAKVKNKPTILEKAWQEYWDVLFPGESDWKSNLELLILNRIVLFSFDAPAFENLKLQQELPDWAQRLKITIDSQVVSMNLGNLKPLTCPLMCEGLIETKPGWKDKHPIEMLDRIILDSKECQMLWEGDCRKILKNAVISIGPFIQNTLGQAIRDGKFDVFAKPTPFNEQTPVPQSTFASRYKVDITRNTIEFSDGGKINSVSVSLVSDKSRSNSFKEDDLVLVEKMKQLIDVGEAASIIAAAKKVLPEAKRRGNAPDESVVERLQRRFGSKYPNYMNQTFKKTTQN
jgi:hypothetical protein